MKIVIIMLLICNFAFTFFVYTKTDNADLHKFISMQTEYNEKNNSYWTSQRKIDKGILNIIDMLTK